MIVADTGPLNYLVQVGSIDLLPIFYVEVLVPHEVAEELRHQDTPAEVRAWFAHPPAWLTVLPPGPHVEDKWGLHAGELAALDLAERMGRQTVLIDERRGRAEAAARSIPVVGTLAVLYRAGVAGMLDFEEQLHALTQKKFHLSKHLRNELLGQWRMFRRGDSRSKV